MLQEYKRKRDFAKTPEPSGAPAKGRKRKFSGLSFVIQKHAATRLHYDFRLEIDGVMVSWAVPKGPSVNPSDKRLAVMTEDHPMEYSSFEGIIPEHQYGAGEVIIWDHGVYSPDEGQEYSWDDSEDANARMRQGLKKGKLSFYLKGDKLEGSWTLVRLHGKEKEWLLIKHHDKFEDDKRDVTEEDESVVSGMTIEYLQDNGAKKVWTRAGAKSANPKTTGKSAKMGKAEEKPKKKELAKELVQKGSKQSFPKSISPMLATMADAPFSRSGWFFEPKLDGVRAIAFVRDGECRLTSRRDNDLTLRYPTITEALAEHEGNYVFDGEVIALDENGRPSFQHLQQSGVALRSWTRSGKPKGGSEKAHLYYYAFDILHCEGRDLTQLPLLERKEILQSVLQPGDVVRLVGSLGEDGQAAFDACERNELEGVVAKREDGVYELGKRAKSWLKIKTSKSAEFIVCGFTEGTGSRNKTFGALLLGEYDDSGKLVYVGSAGTGFDDKKIDALLKIMKPLITKTCPYVSKPKGKLNPTWLKPELVAEVKFLERTQENIIRSPVFMHLREDIEPKKVREPDLVHVQTKSKKTASSRESSLLLSDDAESVLAQLEEAKQSLTLQVGSFKVPVSSLDKVFWPEYKKSAAVTKRDYLRYLAKVSEYVLPHLNNRLITLVRFPNGINAGRFYQKHWEQNLPPFVKTVEVFTEHEDRDQAFLVCNNLPTLLWLGQLADLELHTSHTRIVSTPDAKKLSADMTGSVAQLENSIANYPDFVVLDLDPYLYSGSEAKGAEPELHKKGFQNCVKVARYLKGHLDSVKLKCYLKTSGKTGLHIFIPIKRNIDYDTVRSVSEIFCQQVLRDHPQEVTMDWAVKKRTGKVFMDHNMNARSKSLASIYSPRVAPEGSVSTPIDWDELDEIYPTDFDMNTVPERLSERGDLWSDILDNKNDLHAILKPLLKS